MGIMGGIMENTIASTIWGLGLGPGFGDIPPIVENQAAKNLENTMEIGFIC